MIPVFKNRKLTLNEVGLYLAVLVENLRLMVLTCCLAVLGGLVYYVFATPIYYSKAIIYVHSRQAGTVDSQNIFGDATGGALIGSFSAPHILERTAEVLGVKAKHIQIQEDYLKKYKVDSDSEGNITIEVWAYKFDWAKQWTKTCLDVWLRYREDGRKAYVESLLRNYADDMARVKAKMDEYSREAKTIDEDPRLIQAWKEFQEVGDVPAQLALTQSRFQTIQRVREQLHDPAFDALAKLALASRVTSEIQVGQLLPSGRSAGGAVQQMTAGGVAAPPTVVLPAMISSPNQAWDALDQRKRQIQSKLKDLNRVFLPGHPKIAVLTNELQKVEAELQAELEVVGNRFELEYKIVESTVIKLQADLPLYKERKDRFERLTREVGQMKAGWVTGLEGMYASMAKRLEEVSFGLDRERTQFEYGGFSQLNEKPVSPNRLKLLAFSFIFGLAMAISLPFVIAYLDHTFFMLDQAEQDLGLRGLGVIPLIRPRGNDTPNGNNLLISADENRILRETFRVIRTNLLSKKDVTEAQKVILITSTIPREGKSMISSNTAITFAQLGERVLLIDADMHRGRQHRVFGIDTAPGIAGVLMDGVPLEAAIRPTGVKNLDLLPVGRYRRELPELVASSAFAELVRSAKGGYDRVILDCPPVLGLAETPSLIPLSDGVILIIWSGHTPMNQVKASASLLAANGAKFLGCILNRLNLSSATNYYYYYYHSDYYYYNYHQELPPKPESEAEA